MPLAGLGRRCASVRRPTYSSPESANVPSRAMASGDQVISEPWPDWTVGHTADQSSERSLAAGVPRGSDVPGRAHGSNGCPLGSDFRRFFMSGHDAQ